MKERIQKIYMMLYLKVILITETSANIFEAYQDYIEELIEGIDFLLDYEPTFLYYDRFISEKIYDITNMIKEYNKETKNNNITDTNNNIILKTNRIMKNYSQETRKEYFNKFCDMICCKIEIRDEKDCDDLEDVFLIFIRCYYEDFEKIVRDETIYLSDKALHHLAALNYYLKECKEVCENKFILQKIIEIAYTLDEAFNMLYKLKKIDKDAHKCQKKLMKNINNNIELFKIDKDKLKKIRVKTRENIIINDLDE